MLKKMFITFMQLMWLISPKSEPYNSTIKTCSNT